MENEQELDGKFIETAIENKQGIEWAMKMNERLIGSIGVEKEMTET